MPSTRELRRRIKSVKSTKQITKAMELVAASKMRRASESTLASRPYASKTWEVLRDLTNQPDEVITHPLITSRPVKHALAIVISSDRGLAGVYNTAVLKKAVQWAKEQQELGRGVSFITLGRRIDLSLVRLGYNILQSYPHLPTHPLVTDIFPMSTSATQSFLAGEFDEVQVIYTEFYSMLKQEPLIKQVLPLLPPVQAETTRSRYFLYEPNPSLVLDYILPRLVEVQLYQCLLESLASEHSARRMAMKSATDNASSMIDDLTLTYNGLRQSAITREIAEITSGAAALES